jgi:ABC-type uncharacterized transport system permease subunit
MNSPLAKYLSYALIVIGFIIPFAFLLALIPEIYIYTREDPKEKQHGALLIGITLVLFVVMMLVWVFINTVF